MRPRAALVYQELTEHYNEKSKRFRMVKQVETKMRKLIDTYKENKCKNSKSGSDRLNCPFYDIFDEILGSRDNVTPRFFSRNRYQG